MLRTATKRIPRTVHASMVRKSSTAPPGYVADPAAPPMLRYQASLPRLPVPDLSSTCTKYLETVEPLSTPEDFANTRKTVQEFLKSPLASELQRRLQERAADPNTANWLADWWNEAAYMGYRDPVVVFVSYFFVHVDDRLRRTPAARAASLIKAMLPFRELAESGNLAPDTVRGGAPMCMDSLKWLFHSSRYPVKPSDTAAKFDAKENNHIVVLRKNRFFVVPLATSDGAELSVAQLEQQLQAVIDAAGTGEATAPALGALTSDNRDLWADNRDALLRASPSGKNAESLRKIDSAMIVLALDDTKPITREDISWQTWVGNGRNRWYDKHQLIVYDNGRSGFLGEHSCMDGTPTLRLNEFMLGAIAAGQIPLTSAPSAQLPLPTELTFDLPTAITNAIDAAASRFDSLVAAHDLHVLHYTGLGKAFTKAHKTSPDATAQLIKQLAFHKMFGRPGVTYESAQTRKFQRGRTEVIRAASKESGAWCAAMLDPHAEPAGRDARALRALWDKAVKRHGTYAGWAADGQGVDRHLFGLKKLLRPGEQMPALFTDKSFAKSSHWELSTSQLSSRFVDGWGYGEVVDDGYGVAYAIGDDYIRWTLTSRRRETAVLRHFLEESASEVRRMLEAAAEAEKKERKAAESAEVAKL